QGHTAPQMKGHIMTIHPINRVTATASTVGDLLASVANAFGYTPTESIVVIGLTQDNVLATHVRADLDKVLLNAHAAGVRIGQMMNLEQQQCVVLALTDHTPTPGDYSERIAHHGSLFIAGLETAGLIV